MAVPRNARAIALWLGIALPGGAVLTVPPEAFAQDSRMALSLAPVILAEPETEAPLTIGVGPADQLPHQSFIRIRGLPLAARLTEGHVITPGSWAIPISALGSLKVMAPISASGRTEITIALLTVDGTVLAEAKSALVVAPAWLMGPSPGRSKDEALVQAGLQPPTVTDAKPLEAGRLAAATPAPPAVPPAQIAPKPASPVIASLTPPQPVQVQPPAPVQIAPRLQAAVPPAHAPASPPRALTPDQLQRANHLVTQGDTYRSQGNIAAARQFYRRAADLGLAVAARRLAGTYDAAELAQLSVQGMDPDAAEARRWYQRAQQLGAPEAEARLSRLPAR